MSNSKIVLVDAYSQIFRAFYAVKELRNSKGEPTNALHGFIKILLKLEREYQSDFGAIVFDCGRVNFRMEINPAYKANRKPTPEDLKTQVPMIREFIEAFGWTILEEDQYEADDLIGAIARSFDGNVWFLSSDKDLSQLINGNIVQLVPDIKSTLMERNTGEVIKKFGVTPELLVDYLALLGDSSDNIIGVQGVGTKTAVKILNTYGSLLNLFENPEQIDDEKIREKLLSNQELIRKNIQLITLKCDLPTRLIKLEEVCRKKPMNFEKLFALCERYELKIISKDIEKLCTVDKCSKELSKESDNSIFSDEDSLFFQAPVKPVEVKNNLKTKESTVIQDDFFGDF